VTLYIVIALIAAGIGGAGYYLHVRLMEHLACPTEEHAIQQQKEAERFFGGFAKEPTDRKKLSVE
jgi:hypothetical protein